MASRRDDSSPPELASLKKFSEAFTSVHGDPNLQATAECEMRRLHQTTSAAEYVAKFESKKQYIGWNDEAFRDQFYLNLKDELKDEIAPVGKPGRSQATHCRILKYGIGIYGSL